MEKPRLNEFDKTVLSWLRDAKADDPECCEQDPEDLAETFQEPVEKLLSSLERLRERGDVIIHHHSVGMNGYTAAGGRLVWPDKGAGSAGGAT
jgi:hypothetical protein